MTPEFRFCRGCGTEIAPTLLACPNCHRLVHTARLTTLAAAAEGHQRDGRTVEALASWREALELLPSQSLQAKTITDKVLGLSREVDQGGSADQHRHRPAWATGIGLAGTLGLLIWKLKFVLAFVLTKGKLLLSGFTQAGTVFSMAATLGLYWAAWGWVFALGLVLSIYVHEMGHVAALRRFGLRTSAPMFVPGFGAFVRLRQPLASPQEEARVGLAGPAFGLGAALVCVGLSAATGSGAFGAIAQWGARINLFNLIPVRPLDGGRGFAPLSRRQVLLVTAATGLVLAATGEPFLWPVFLVSMIRLLAPGHGPGDRRTVIDLLVLVAGLAAIAAIPVLVPPAP